VSQSKEIIVGGELTRGVYKRGVQGGSVALRWVQHVGVAVSRAFQSATVVSSIFCDHLPHFSQTCNFRVFIQVLFFIAQSLKMESSKVM
jgi:hypothetical protein